MPCDSQYKKDDEQPDTPETPLPLYQMVPMVFVLLNESLCGSMIQPFSPMLIAHLMGVTKNEAGYVSGIVVGIFMLGQVVSARTWGWMSDKYGRRFPLISGLFTSGLAMLGFGLSTNIYQLAVFRFLHGVFNGNMLVAKTMMADITDRTNETKGFSFVSFVSAIGFLIGPSLGGMLYDPVNSTTLSWLGLEKGGIFDTHPALLPSLFVFFYTLVGITVCTVFVRETNPKAKPLPIFLKFLCPCFLFPSKRFVPLSADTTLLVAETIDTEGEEMHSIDDGTERESGREEKPAPRTTESVTIDSDVTASEEVYITFGYKEAFLRPHTRFMLIQYMALVFADTSLKECLNLWVISTKEVGGLDLGQLALSFILLFNSIPLFISNLVFHKICALYKDRMAFFRISIIIAGIAALNMPLGSYVPNFTLAIIYILLSTSVRQMCCSWCYSLNTMLTARSAPMGHVGSIMGINQSCGAAMRGIAPLVASPIFAFSIRKPHPFPFNHVFVFFLSAITLFICGYRSYRIRTNDKGDLELVN